MKTITPKELKAEIDKGEKWQMIDVRDPYETEVACLGVLKIPMAEISLTRDESKAPVICF